MLEALEESSVSLTLWIRSLWAEGKRGGNVVTDKRNELISLLVVVDLFLPAVKEYCVPGLRGSGHQ